MFRLADSSLRVRSSLVLAGLLSVVVLSACSDATDPMPARGLAPTQPAGYLALAGELTATPDTIDFGTVLLGGESAPKTVTIKNTGTGPLALWSAYGIGAGDFLPVPSNGDCVLDQPMQPGDQCTFTWVFKPLAIGQRVGYQQLLSDGGNVNVQFVGESYSDADVAVSIAANPTTVQAGKPLTYTIAITNRGPGNATGITLTDVLPSMTTFSSISSSIKTLPCTTPAVGSTGTVACELSWMPAGTTVTYQLVVNVPSGGRYSSIVNTAAITTTSTDKVSSNDSASITVSTRGKK
jgi:uncharacterized repeat protein (TIGR01451 family)